MGAYLSLNNSTNIQPALYAETGGLGNAGSFRINNSGNTTAALFASTGGGGSAAEFESNNLSPTVFAHNDGLGAGGEFAVTNSITASPAVWGRSDGLGAAGVFQIMNPASSASALVAQSSGTGPAGTFLGDLQVSEDLYKNYGTGGYARGVPVAYGTFDNSGSLLTGSGNLSGVWVPVFERFEITIDNEFFSNTDYTAVVTPIGGFLPVTAAVASDSGRMVVTFHQINLDAFPNPTATKISPFFHVVIFHGN